jgi:uncharacterized membrane protein
MVTREAIRADAINMVEVTAMLIELVAVGVIVAFILLALWKYLLPSLRNDDGALRAFKTMLGKSLLLGLELLVAADVIRTVALEPTLRNIAALGLLVLVRTFLSWSVELEVDGRWPWQSAPPKPPPPVSD